MLVAVLAHAPQCQVLLNSCDDLLTQLTNGGEVTKIDESQLSPRASSWRASVTQEREIVMKHRLFEVVFKKALVRVIEDGRPGNLMQVNQELVNCSSLQPG